MIVYPSRHLFEALSPALEEGEKELRFYHPTEDLYCNQLGVLFYNEEKYYMVTYKSTITIRYIDSDSGHQTKKALGTKARVVWECYNGHEFSKGHTHFYHRNGNILDFSYGNIVITEELSSKERMMAAGKRRRFIQESIQYLMQLEKKHEEGMGIEALHQSLMLPDWLINGRQKLGRALPKLKSKKTSTGAGRKSLVTFEEENKVESLYWEGFTFKQITAEMGWKSLTKAKRIARMRGLSRRKK